MSELINTTGRWDGFHRQLLATVSAAAMLSCVAGEAQAADGDADRPTVWIELGGQLERMSGGDGAFVSPFYSHIDPSLESPAKVVDGLPLSFGPEGKISFQPEGSDWIFSVGMRYGRAKSHRSSHQQTNPGKVTNVIPTVQIHYSAGGSATQFITHCCSSYAATPHKPGFTDVQANHKESHTILDFQVGKDVGLGLFGRHSTSTIGAGMRFAQFSSQTDATVRAEGDVHRYNGFAFAYPYFVAGYPQKYTVATNFRTYSLAAGSSRSFRGIGPSLSWDSSASLWGNPETSQLTFDWGVNLSVLFGRQKAQIHHQSSGHQQYEKYPNPRGYSLLYSHPRVDHARSRNVTVPNVGGMAGFSVRFPNAKVSFGYKADFFFGAMDGGWDTRKSENRSFQGPFASVSIGLGG